MSTFSIQAQSYALYDQGWHLIFENMQEAIKVINQAHELSISIQDPIGIAKYKFNMAVVHYQKGSLELALQLVVDAKSTFDELENELYLNDSCKCYLLSGKIYWDLGSRDKGIDYLTKGYELAKTIHNTELEGRALGFLATSYYDVEEFELALSYFIQTEKLFEGTPPNALSVRFTIMMGCIYKELGDYSQALHYLQLGAELSQTIRSPVLLGRVFNDLANTYFAIKVTDKASDYFEQSLKIRKQLQQPLGVTTTLLDMAFFYMECGDLDLAVAHVNEALALAEPLNLKPKVQRAYELLAALYEYKNDIERAYHYYKAFHHLKSEIDHSTAEAKLNNNRLSLQAEQAEREFQQAIAQNKVLAAMNDQLERTNAELDMEKQKSERLLLNILPIPIADRLKNGETLIADSYDEVTVLFADIVGFTHLSSGLTPENVVQFLNRVFLLFDELIARYGLEKIKTIGDAYMVVGGIPLPSASQTERMADMALEMVESFHAFTQEMSLSVGIRIGIHRGAAVAGVIGSSKFSYDIWGDTVNIASRMETSSESGAVHVTEAVYRTLKDRFTFEHRGSVAIKGKGEMSTFFLIGRAPE